MHSGEAVADLMEDYFLQRRVKGLDSAHYHHKLQALGKSEEEISEILMELNDDWQKEQMFEAEKKSIPQHIGLGILIVALCFAIPVFASQEELFKNSTNIVWAAGMASGFMLIFKAFSLRKKAKIRLDRRRMKYKMYK